ncbi:MAG: methyltransferase [Gammaproteobacteria bacterium]|nr:methyltransferase [Gammaproteobacteria bacterium]
MPDWNSVYTEKSVENSTPADVLLKNSHLLSCKGKALDYASGLAGNGIYLAKNGYNVKAWDMSDVAVEKINQYARNNNLLLNAEVYDLENNSPKIQNQYDVVVVSYFLHRETLRYLYDVLKKGGLLFYQTFSGLQYKEQGPARKAFRLKKNELLDVFSDMQLLYYREDDENANGPESKQGQVFFVAKK